MGGGVSINTSTDTFLIKTIEDKPIHNYRRNNNNHNHNNNNNNNERLITTLQTLPTINQQLNLGEDSISNNNIHDNYIIGNILGIGSFSVVYTAINKYNQNIYAIKRVNIPYIITQSKGITSVINELNIYQRIGSHNNIINLHCAYRLRMHCYFILDYLSGGDLRQFMLLHGKLSQESIAYIIASIGSALHHMHSRKIIHRDVKPENIGFDSRGKPYLTDFGISYFPSTIETNSMIVCSNSSGTLPYLAPEILTPNHYHSYQSDFWSLGIITYELIYLGHLPYKPHAPNNFIRFVGNNYHKMWLNLLNKSNQIKQVTTPRSNKNVTNNDSPSPTSRSADKSSDKNLFDMNENQSGSTKSNDQDKNIDLNESYILPYPDYHERLNSDGTLPESYRINPPPRRSSRVISSEIPLEYVLSDFQDLIQGLLDLRIPQRYGSLNNFSQFSHHSIFRFYGFDDINNLHFISSPLVKEDWYGILSGHIASNRFLKVRNESEFQQDLFSPEIENVLQKFKYVRNEINDNYNEQESSGEKI